MSRKVTLYIEDSEIKLVVCDGKKVIKWASLVLEQKLVNNGVIQDEKQIALEIKNIFQAAGVKDNKVIVGLSGLNSVFRFITFPSDIPRNMIDEAIVNEARRVLPMSVEQVYLSYQQISNTKEEQQYFLAAYPRNATDSLINTVKAAGLKIQSLDLAPLALARCVNEPIAVIVNSWLTYLDIIVLSEGQPKVIRSLSLPIESDEVDQKLPAIGEEIIRTVMYYKTSYPDSTLGDSTPIMVCGDLANKEDELKTYLGELKNDVFTITAPISVESEFPSCRYMINIGMSVKGELPKGKDSYYSIIDLEALPRIYQPPKTKLSNILIPVLIVVALGGLFYGWLFLQDTIEYTKKMRAELSQMQAQSTVLNGSIAVLNEEAGNLEQELSLAEDANDLKQDGILLAQASIDEQTQINLLPIAENDRAVVMQEMLDKLTDGFVKSNADLSVINESAAGLVDVTNVVYGIEQADISGSSYNEDDVYAFAYDLRNSGQFESVTVTSLSQGDGILIFNINVTW
jgi:type IV pilus assembly protein PilM